MLLSFESYPLFKDNLLRSNRRHMIARKKKNSHLIFLRDFKTIGAKLKTTAHEIVKNALDHIKYSKICSPQSYWNNYSAPSFSLKSSNSLMRNRIRKSFLAFVSLYIQHSDSIRTFWKQTSLFGFLSLSLRMDSCKE